VREASGIVFGFDREDRQKRDNSYTFYLRYVGPLPSANDVKVDITLREQLVYSAAGPRYPPRLRRIRRLA